MVVVPDDMMNKMMFKVLKRYIFQQMRQTGTMSVCRSMAPLRKNNDRMLCTMS